MVHLIDIITVDQGLHDVGTLVSASGYGVRGEIGTREQRAVAQEVREGEVI